MTQRFSGKAALITGAAGGIGRATALAFAEEGANLMLVDLNQEGCEETAQMAEDLGVEVEMYCVDATLPEVPATMVSKTVERFGQLDIAFNNLGITGPNVDVTDYSDEDWDRVMNVNLRSIFRAMKEEIKAMRLTNNGGAIVNTASVASLVAIPMSVGYIASKHALLGLTKAASLDAIKDDIRINAVCPAVIDTPLIKQAKSIPGFLEGMVASHPIGRIGQPEEVAKAVLFLSSDESSFMMGQGMVVDGGVTIL